MVTEMQMLGKLLLLLLLLLYNIIKRFFNPEVPYCYSFVLEELQLLTLRVRRHRFDAFFLTQVYSGSKFCPSVLEIVGL
jgi:hypothetical protein